MDYYIPPPQYKAPDMMSTIAQFGGLAQMAQQAKQAPVNLATSKANLEAIKLGLDQAKVMNPLNVQTAQTNLGILSNSLDQQKKMNPIQLGIAENTRDQGTEALRLAKMTNDLQEEKRFNMKSAIQEVQANPSSKAAQNALLAFSAMDPAGAQSLESVIGKTTEQQRRLVFDANFNAFIGMKNGSPDAAIEAITQARDAAVASGQPQLAKKFEWDLGMIQKDPESAFNKFTLIAASSPDHRQAMDQLTKTQTLPSQVQAQVNKYVENAGAAVKQGNTVKDLLRRWEGEPDDSKGFFRKMLSKGRIGTASEEPGDILRKETEAAFNLERLKLFKEEIGSMGIRNLAEFETALAGKTDPYGAKNQVVERLQRIVEFADKEQAFQQANADWLTTFRGSSVATRNATVNGIQIPKGSNVQGFKKAIALQLFPEAQPPAGNAPVTVTMPDGKTGTIPRDQVDAFKKKYPGAKFQ
jgi:hypothetical protein